MFVGDICSSVVGRRLNSHDVGPSPDSQVVSDRPRSVGIRRQVNASDWFGTTWRPLQGPILDSQRQPTSVVQFSPAILRLQGVRTSDAPLPNKESWNPVDWGKNTYRNPSSHFDLTGNPELSIKAIVIQTNSTHRQTPLPTG